MSPGVSAGHDGPEERRSRRVPVDLPGGLAGRSPRPARVLDASLVGCLVRCDVQLDVGAVLDVQIELPDGPLRAKARVAESSLDGSSLPGPTLQYLAGLEFLRLAAADELRLRSFLEAERKRRRGADQAPP